MTGGSVSLILFDTPSISPSPPVAVAVAVARPCTLPAKYADAEARLGCKDVVVGLTPPCPSSLLEQLLRTQRFSFSLESSDRLITSAVMDDAIFSLSLLSLSRSPAKKIKKRGGITMNDYKRFQKADLLASCLTFAQRTSPEEAMWFVGSSSITVLKSD